QKFFFSEDKLINDIEPKNLKVPILIKKYLKQNAKVIGFNRDRSFNNVIDALLFIAIKDLPESTVKPVLDEFSLMSLSQSDPD
ncbi:MAG: glycerol acyltransferase, partial [Bacteroidetes bacterium]|nr:glycerol acyltransferase [Bacteroidota bacterium]